MITLTISRKDLVALDGTPACAGGRALFDAIKAEYDDARAKAGKAPRRGLTVTWTRTHQVWIAVAYPSFAAWLRDNGTAPNVSLCGANLRGANLCGANLCGAYLYGAHLYGARIAKSATPPPGWRAVDIGSDYEVTLAKG